MESKHTPCSPLLHSFILTTPYRHSVMGAVNKASLFADNDLELILTNCLLKGLALPQCNSCSISICFRLLRAITSPLSLSLSPFSALPPAFLSLPFALSLFIPSLRPPSRFLHALLDPAEDLSGDGKVLLLFINLVFLVLAALTRCTLLGSR